MSVLKILTVSHTCAVQDSLTRVAATCEGRDSGGMRHRTGFYFTRDGIRRFALARRGRSRTRSGIRGIARAVPTILTTLGARRGPGPANWHDRGRPRCTSAGPSKAGRGAARRGGDRGERPSPPGGRVRPRPSPPGGRRSRRRGQLLASRPSTCAGTNSQESGPRPSKRPISCSSARNRRDRTDGEALEAVGVVPPLGTSRAKVAALCAAMPASGRIRASCPA